MRFAPGDIVECVDAYAAHLERGAIYTVLRVSSVQDDGAYGVKVDGAPTPGCDYPFDFWHADRFRHVYRPDPKLIELLQREPAPELEAA